MDVDKYGNSRPSTNGRPSRPLTTTDLANGPGKRKGRLTKKQRLEEENAARLEEEEAHKAHQKAMIEQLVIDDEPLTEIMQMHKEKEGIEK